MNEVKVIVVLIYHFYIARLKDFETPLYGDSLHIFQLSGGEGGGGGLIFRDFSRNKRAFLLALFSVFLLFVLDSV